MAVLRNIMFASMFVRWRAHDETGVQQMHIKQDEVWHMMSSCTEDIVSRLNAESHTRGCVSSITSSTIRSRLTFSCLMVSLPCTGTNSSG